MGLGSDPSMQEIWAEFATNSKPFTPSGTTYSLTDARLAVFGGGVTNNRKAFAHKGQPSANTHSASGVSQQEATLNGSVNPNGVDSTFFFEWADNSSFDNSETTSPQYSSSSSDETVIELLENLDDDTTYYYRVIAYNGFNEDSRDWKSGGTVSFTTEQALESTPYNATTNQLAIDSGEVEVQWDIDYTNLAMEVEWERNGSFWTYVSANAGETSQSVVFADGDSIRARVRYTETGTTGATTSFGSWSNITNVSIVS